MNIMADKDHLEDVKSPIVMKVDAPPDDSANSEENNSNENKNSQDNGGSENSGTSCTLNNQQTSKVPILAKPKFGVGNPFAIKHNVLSSPKLNLNNTSSKTLLRPSKLSTVNDETTTTTTTSDTNNIKKQPFVLNPPQLINPFIKTVVNNDDLPNNNDEENSTITQSADTKKCIDTPKFVPLTTGSSSSTQSNNNSSGGNSSTSSNSPSNFTLNSSGSFVFGQNLHERVVGENVDGKNNGIENSTSTTPSSSSTSCSNGTSSSSTVETLFSNAAVVNNENKSNNELIGEGATTTTSSTIPTATKSLSEAAREYEESRAQKRKYEEVAVITGEENEENIMQITCKLFAFDQTTRNWQERGRGNLRLNDIIMPSSSEAGDNTLLVNKSSSSNDDVQSSRLVIRATGSLRVVLNTKIWAGMSVELASPKSIRLTAMDSSGVVKVFLVMGNVKEIEKLHKLLKNRVENEIKRQNKLIETVTGDNNTADPASKRKPSTDFNV